MLRMFRAFKLFSFFLFALFLSHCGSGSSEFDADISTESFPIVSRIDPENASIGDTITIYGLGFSLVPSNNVVVIGEISATAESYSLVDPAVGTEVEALTVTVPADASVGENSVTVLVGSNLSNSDILLTVDP
ncbi:MAG: hypothetical protein COX62_00605 [Deltaproteobacteria bacterium CG_4_10_14_0_2_um_filter_43_8]|nr:MAG: hypothetical protein COV43_06005 [Deltaproteobacteria bacterium CG11_big_fil_rev_8_21_14_0_20_42_23]PJA22146.1 MAG: hypothetical protein COX62_00605 [Deltaproteobacteria bacterium CG_4_10_14_0_2_um_filter_43_8]PJC65138.1 MAG: hypothetical protein CO021_01430 [Deltaproteobacteria bacterium CG_4_9_14_0_2_um_filter_42_21]